MMRDCQGLLTKDVRAEMIRETSTFLTWALLEERQLPRIARRKVSDGGFSFLRTRPGAEAMLEQWWQRTLERVSDFW